VFIKDGLTTLGLCFFSCPIIGERHVVTFCNFGGVSKGVTVILFGEGIKDNNIQVNEMTVDKEKNPRLLEFIRNKGGEREIHSAMAQKCELSDGTTALRFDFNDFEFQEGINQRHPSMNGKKGYDIFFAHTCCLRFTVTSKLAGKQYIRFAVIPQNNKKGQAACKIAIHETREQAYNELGDDFNNREYYGEIGAPYIP
jgi:hypothetical protein